MKLEEFKNAIAEIQIRADKKKDKVAKEYAFANNTIKEGDIIKSLSNEIGKVLKIKWSYYSDKMPVCVYVCQVLTKKLVPRKNSPAENFWQFNVTEILVNGKFEKI